MIKRHPWGGLADPAFRLPADFLILGLPYDGSACWRGGAREAPARLREISASSPAVSEVGEVVTPDRLRVVDLGDINPEGGDDPAARERYFDRIAREVTEHLKEPGGAGPAPFLLTLGGDHSVSIPLLRGFAPGASQPYGLVSLDAHPDLFDTYDGSPLSNACPLRRALDSGRLAPEHLLILGTRSYNPVELEFMRRNGIRFVPALELDAMGVAAAVSLAQERLAGVGRVYLTVDIDVADPACAPGTGAPVAGGLSSRQLLNLIRGLLRTLPVRGMDLVEIAPPLDPTGATLFLGLQIVFETFAVAAERRAAPISS